MERKRSRAARARMIRRTRRTGFAPRTPDTRDGGTPVTSRVPLVPPAMRRVAAAGLLRRRRPARRERCGAGRSAAGRCPPRSGCRSPPACAGRGRPGPWAWRAHRHRSCGAGRRRGRYAGRGGGRRAGGGWPPARRSRQRSRTGASRSRTGADGWHAGSPARGRWRVLRSRRSSRRRCGAAVAAARGIPAVGLRRLDAPPPRPARAGPETTRAWAWRAHRHRSCRAGRRRRTHARTRRPPSNQAADRRLADPGLAPRTGASRSRTGADGWHAGSPARGP